MPAEDFDQFLKAAWAEHGDHPQQVADRLASSLSLVQAPPQVRPFAALVSHVDGEHLGEWQAGIDLLESLRTLPAFDGSAAVVEPVRRAIATLRYAGGDASALGALDAHDRTFVLASAAATFTGRGELDRAIAAYSQALKAGEVDLAPASPAVRALAIGGNNLASALEGKADATPRELDAMVGAAEGGLVFWKRAGTWLEEERAEYRLARSLLRAGRAADAVASAQRCVDVCRRNEAPPFELFFGHVVLALAHRAAGDDGQFATRRGLALDLLAQVPEGEKAWCERARAENWAEPPPCHCGLDPQSSAVTERPRCWMPGQARHDTFRGLGAQPAARCLPWYLRRERRRHVPLPRPTTSPRSCSALPDPLTMPDTPPTNDPAAEDLPPLPSPRLGRYRHYKGGVYDVVGVARHSETLEPMVVYRPLYGAAGLWVRPYAMFFEHIEAEGRSQPRFAPVIADPDEGPVT